ncbi:MAG: signal peptidase I, partial [Spirochaetales bacterium]|nr:signal peptidase I [Spirochaetales bacterium]
FLEFAKPALRRLFWIALGWTAAFDVLLLVLAEPLHAAAWVFTGVKWMAAAFFLALQARASRSGEWKRLFFLSRIALFYAVALQGFQHFYGVSLMSDGALKYLVFYVSLATVILPAVAFYMKGFGNKALVERGVMIKEKGKYRHGFEGGFLLGVLDWVDAIVGAFVLVVYLNSLLVQCYVIPSGSMEKTLLVGDRLMALKLADGIEPPFSDVKLPRLARPDRGDIVILHNPRIPEAERRELSFIFGQYLQFLSNAFFRESSAQAVAEPLVKRIVGVPGERISMVNDVVYVEREGEAPRVLEEPYVQTFANAGSAMSLSSGAAEVLETDAFFAGLELESLESSTRGILARLERRYGANPESGAGALVGPSILEFRDASVGFASGLARGELSWPAFEAFILAPYARKPSGLYETQAAKIDAWLKSRLAGSVETLLSGGNSAAKAFDDERLRYVLETWLLRHYDARNFAPFPADGYLGEDEWFLMGDNRYDSLDGRHLRFSWQERPIREGDPASFTYPSLLEPFAIPGKLFFAKPLFVGWPLSSAKILSAP